MAGGERDSPSDGGDQPSAPGDQVDVSILPALHAALLQPRGEFSVAFALTWGPALAEVPGFIDGMHQIVDFSLLAPGNPSRAEIDMLVHALTTRDRSDLDFLVAYVAPSDLKFGVTRMFEIMSDAHMPRGRAVFRTLDDALAWVAEEGVASA